MRATRPQAALVVPLLLACAARTPGAAAASRAAGGEPPRLQLPLDARPVHYALHLELVPSRPGFRGEVDIEVDLDREAQGLWLHARDLRISEAWATAPGRAARVAARLEQRTPDGVARVTLAEALGPGRATLHVAFEGTWAEDLEGAMRARVAGDTYVATQLEPVAARRVFPCFDDPGFKTSFDVALTVPESDVAVSNGPVLSEGPAGTGLKRVRFATTPPLPTYLVFVAAGPFQVVAPPPLPPGGPRTRPLALRALAPRGRDTSLGFALAAAAAFVPWYERWFDAPFPYEKLDLVAFPEFAGAMENAGAIAFADRLLVTDAATTHARRRAIASVLSHEIAHQWFGDLVTPAWWTDIWLNESFATWIESQAVDAWRPELAASLTDLADAMARMDGDGLASARAVRQPLRDVAAVWDQFDAASYDKGGHVLGMLERYAGRERFRDGVRRYLREHAHGTGSTPALLAAVDAAADRDVTGPAGSFLDQPGVPLVAARLQCAASGARVELVQRRWRPRGASTPDQRWEIPVCLRWEAAGAQQERCALLSGERAELALGAACPAWILPNAGGAGYYLGSLQPRDLAALRERGLPRLTLAERVSLAWAVDGARRAGALPAADELATLEALAGDEDAEVLGAVLDVVSRLADLVPAGAEPPFRRWAAARFRPALLRAGVRPRPGEPGASATLRARLVEFLGVRAQDPALAPILAEVAGDRGDPDLANAMAVVEVQARGADAAAALAGDLDRELPPGERARVVYALLNHDAPALREPTRRLWRDARLRRSDRIVWPLRETPAQALLDALAEDFEGTLALFASWAQTRLPLALRGHCCDGQEARLEAVFGAHVARHPEMRRSYDQAIERARWCAAERAADGPAIAAWIAARPSP